MTKEAFEKVILNLQLALKRSRELYKLGLDMTQVEEPYQAVIDILLNVSFNNNQVEWINWYLYDKVGIKGEVLQAYKTVDGKQVEICYDIDSLWETVCEAGQQADFDNRLGG
jgi:hypothetical protein